MTSAAPSTRPRNLVTWTDLQIRRLRAFVEEVGGATLLAGRAFRTIFTTRFETTEFIYQLEQLGVRSLAIGAATAIFVGIVMTIQFAVSMEAFGAKDTLGRVLAVSEARELAPSLTALVVGSRVAAGIAAELGSMMVTEQVDAIRALGADPIRKLVVPRLVACMIIMPLITFVAFLLGMTSSMLVAALSYGIPMEFFASTALDSLRLNDFVSGVAKTPFFGLLIAILGCYFGLQTRGGTEGVGRSTTRAVVVVSISILMADALLTQIFVSLGTL
ncbi:MAG: MlaE family lipid ABC transporter permease subunit [Myxococcales bacterium]|nr:MlaE family lipid ABC transporter permease subunit [Myxococcales bacterium]